VGISVSAEIKQELAIKGYYIEELPDADGPPKTTYHNPRTGQEFRRLPADAWGISHYLGRGLRVGPAPEDLRQAWEQRPAQARPELDSSLTFELPEASPQQPTNNLEALVLALQRQVAELTAKLTGEPAIPVAIAPIKPTQLKLL